jgi:hypothetical protein
MSGQTTSTTRAFRVNSAPNIIHTEANSNLPKKSAAMIIIPPLESNVFQGTVFKGAYRLSSLFPLPLPAERSCSSMPKALVFVDDETQTKDDDNESNPFYGDRNIRSQIHVQLQRRYLWFLHLHHRHCNCTMDISRHIESFNHPISCAGKVVSIEQLMMHITYLGGFDQVTSWRALCKRIGVSHVTSTSFPSRLKKWMQGMMYRKQC